jgi:maleylacetate reductase
VATGPDANFVWGDAGRTVIFRAGVLSAAPEVLAGYGFGRFELLSTPRARTGAASLAGAAAANHDVAPGPVAAVAEALVSEVGGELPLVALGGGRVIDTAKAVAAVRGLEVATLATTMSGAEMTDLHALPAGRRPARGHLRPTFVLADPEAMTGAREPALRASSMNALAHGADSLYTPFANPLSRHAALQGARLIAAALDEPRAGRDRAALAQGSLLCGYAIDSGRLGLHHVVCQTLARVIGTPHAENNAAVLPHSLAFLVAAGADGMAELASAIGAEPGTLAARVRELGGEPAGLGALGADRDLVDAALDAMLARRELSFAPGPPTREDLAAIVAAAW